jgi:hypothetical protein
MERQRRIELATYWIEQCYSGECALSIQRPVRRANVSEQPNGREEGRSMDG